MKIISLSFFLLALTFLYSCEKTDFNYPPGTVGISKIIYFPSVSINGERLIIMDQGGAFTDPGATAILNGQSVQYTTTGTVDPSTPGVYGLQYTATNPEGYSASDWRTVVVIGSDVAGNDFSGTYLRAATGVTSTWTKDSSGVYSVENPGGASVGAGLHVIAVNYTGTMISIPHQISPDYGEVSSSDETYSLTPPPPTYSWVFHAGGYGTSLRTFVKQ
ncbi:MAG TPA: immunoglobulin-like domain-containing protein [Puia sp.]|nr:immunoglobulin-like domain-containing protein [Puia sp.]